MANRKGEWRKADEGVVGFSMLGMRARYALANDTANLLMARCYRGELAAAGRADVAGMDRMRVDRLQVMRDMNRAHADDVDALMALWWKWDRRIAALEQGEHDERGGDPLKALLAPAEPERPSDEDLRAMWREDIRPLSLAGVRPSSEPTTVLMVGARADCPLLMRRWGRALYPMGGIGMVDRELYGMLSPGFLDALDADPFRAVGETGAAADSWLADSMDLAARNRANTLSFVDPGRARILAAAALRAKRRVTVMLMPCDMAWGRLALAERFVWDRAHGRVWPWLTPDGYAAERAAVDGLLADGGFMSGVTRFLVLAEDGSPVYDGGDAGVVRRVCAERGAGSLSDGGRRVLSGRVDALRAVSSAAGLEDAPAFWDWVLEG